jgi:hypothetical protein
MGRACRMNWGEEEKGRRRKRRENKATRKTIN